MNRINILLNILIGSATPIFTTVVFGTPFRKNELGNKRIQNPITGEVTTNTQFPALFIELPFLYDINDTDGTISYSIALYALTQRITKTIEEELEQYNYCDNLLNEYLEVLTASAVSLTNNTFISYSGEEEKAFSADVNGIRTEFKITISCGL